MNALLVIQKDTEIIHKIPPSTEEIEAFEEETGDGPELNPMRLCFDVKITHCWNNDLAEQFVEWFMGRHDVDASQESLLHELFTNRFISLKRRYNEWRIKEGEDAVQRADRVTEKRRKGRKMQRKDTRRNNVSELIVNV
jgi:hypothetical protein